MRLAHRQQMAGGSSDDSHRQRWGNLHLRSTDSFHRFPSASATNDPPRSRSDNVSSSVVLFYFVFIFRKSTAVWVRRSNLEGKAKRGGLLNPVSRGRWSYRHPVSGKLAVSRNWLRLAATRRGTASCRLVELSSSLRSGTGVPVCVKFGIIEREFYYFSNFNQESFFKI